MAKILTINPGSTSTKIAVYENLTLAFMTNISHSADELLPFNSVVEQFLFRKAMILKTLSE
ncbi:MAG: butyrate kinase, partial [Paludibacter sp.]|nr:butyrate kinase [Paludibacter sp.]